eukprot:ANDGO_02765.mRNA.1 hypothetical protein
MEPNACKAFWESVQSRPLDLLFWLSWLSPDPSFPNTSNHAHATISDSVLLNNGKPKKWYFTDHDGCLRQKKKDNLSYHRILDTFSRSQTHHLGQVHGASVPVAIFYRRMADHVVSSQADASSSPQQPLQSPNTDLIPPTHILPFISASDRKKMNRPPKQCFGEEEAVPGEKDVVRMFLHAEGLKEFCGLCETGGISPTGLLVKFVPCASQVTCVRVSMVRDRVVSLESVRNVNEIRDPVFSMRQRASTESWQYTRLLHPSKTLEIQVRFQAEHLMRHIISVVESRTTVGNRIRKSIRACSFYFHIDSTSSPVLVWTSPNAIEFGDYNSIDKQISVTGARVVQTTGSYNNAAPVKSAPEANRKDRGSAADPPNAAAPPESTTVNAPAPTTADGMQIRPYVEKRPHRDSLSTVQDAKSFKRRTDAFRLMTDSEKKRSRRNLSSGQVYYPPGVEPMRDPGPMFPEPFVKNHHAGESPKAIVVKEQPQPRTVPRERVSHSKKPRKQPSPSDNEVDGWNSRSASRNRSPILATYVNGSSAYVSPGFVLPVIQA